MLKTVENRKQNVTNRKRSAADLINTVFINMQSVIIITIL